MFEPISELAEINPPLSVSALIHSGDFISFIPMSDVSESGQWLTYRTRAFSQVKSGFTPFQEGDVLFAKITPCMENGKGAQAVGLEKGIGYGSTEFHILRAKADNSPRYIFHLSQSSNLRLKAEASMIGSAGQKRVPSEFFRKHRVFAPIPAEQRLIARILDTLDTQIEKTEALIAKLEKVKEGLLHDLLTRGIDENGQLRPSPEQAPELYQESPLGMIPREWECQTLGEIAQILHGYAFEGEFFSDKPEGKRLLTPGNFHRNGGLYFEAGNSKWFKGKIPLGYVLSNGDAVTVMTDLSPKTLILGRAVVLDEGEDLLHNQRIGKILLRDHSANCINFVVLVVNSPSFRRQVVVEATGTTVRHTSPERIMSVKMATPPKAEQLRIETSYRATITKIHSERSALQKLIYEKASLMDDLLTGRVRVTPLLEQLNEATSA